MNELIKVVKFALIVAVVINLLSCTTFGPFAEMQSQMDEIQEEQQVMQETYSDAQAFLMALMAEGEIRNPAEFARSIVATKEAIQAGIVRLEDITKDIEDLQAAQMEQLDQERRDIVSELNVYRSGLEQRIAEANTALNEIITNTNSQFQLSLRGMQGEIDELQTDVDRRLTTTIRGLQTEQNETIDSLERELKILILGRDSVLDSVQRQVSILARSLESVSRELLAQ